MPKSIADTIDGICRFHTRVYETEQGITVQLYDTVVFQQTPDRLLLNTGGFATATTASRIHQALIHRGIKGHVNVKGGKMYFTCESLGTIPFVDNKLELWLNDGQVG